MPPLGRSPGTNEADGAASRDVAALRAAAQWLPTRPGTSVDAVAGRLVGLQAQDTAAMRLQVRARSASLTADDVRAACATPGRLVRTWLLRGTLHLVAAADVRWLLRLVGERNAARSAGRRRQLGLDEATCRAALAALPRILDDGRPRSRAVLVEALRARGVAIAPKGQAPAHLLSYAAARGLVCRGPDLDGDEPGYVLLDAWAPPATDGDGSPESPGSPGSPELTGTDDLLGRLAGRYLRAYGPATAADLASWSGLALGLARRGMAAVAHEHVDLGGGLLVHPSALEPVATRSSGGAVRVVRLLGAYDPYVLGHRDRTAVLTAEHARHVQTGGGTIPPTVVVDGRVVGTWRWVRKGARAGVTVAVQPFGALPRAAVAGVHEEARDLARFLELPSVRAEVVRW